MLALHMDTHAIAPVIDLFHRSFAVPLIAILYKDSGAKFVTLVNQLSASRATVNLTLKYLVSRNLVMRNPGYGHPMRPEYILTGEGERIGPVCLELVRTVAKLKVDEIAFRKWPMPVVAAIGKGASRFSGIGEKLQQVSPRALTGALRDLGDFGLVDREVTGDWPPHPNYELSRNGQVLVPVLDELCVARST